MLTDELKSLFNLCFLTITFLCPVNIFAQHVTEGIKLSHYVFEEFSAGTVKMKSGETYQRVLNYNILTNEMIFNNDGKYLAIAEPANVDTVYIDERKFIPLNKKFYEVLVNKKWPLLLEFTSTISETGASIGYGGTSATTATTSYKSLISSGGAYELKLPEGFTVIPAFAYWILKDGKPEKAGSIKQLEKIFPGKKDSIETLVKTNHTNFSKREDLMLLVDQVE